MSRFAAPLLLLLGTVGCYESHGLAQLDGPDAPDAAADGNDNGTSGDSITSDADVDDESPSDAEARDDAAGSPGVLFRLRFLSDVPASIWVNDTGPEAPSTDWFLLSRDGWGLQTEPACDFCFCDDCPACSVCTGEPCPSVAELPAGSSRDYRWDGYEYPREICAADGSTTCQREQLAPPGVYSIMFCWSRSFTGTPPCPAWPGELTCEQVPFVYPDADGLVEFVVDEGG